MMRRAFSYPYTRCLSGDPASRWLWPTSGACMGPGRTIVSLATTLVVLALVGCSHSGFDSKVSGRVTLDGRSIGPGVVVFAATEAGKGNPARGTIQPNGSYTLMTANTDGLNPGKYKVSVSVVDEPVPPPGVRNMTLGKQLVPEKFTDVNTSGLEYDVKPGRNTIHIELTSK
jgi:hypothetical protein